LNGNKVCFLRASFTFNLYFVFQASAWTTKTQIKQFLLRWLQLDMLILLSLVFAKLHTQVTYPPSNSRFGIDFFFFPTEAPGDIPDIQFDKEQMGFVRLLQATNKPVVLVILEGRPRVLDQDVVNNASAILLGLLPGPDAGIPIVEVRIFQTFVMVTL
jgi:hypothetical protein